MHAWISPLLAAAVTLASCRQRTPSPSPAQPPAVTAAQRTAARRAAARTGIPAPELPPLEVLEGAPVRLAALRGRVVLLHFWTFG